jgi:sigma-B regulation protein RsbU (phosphoserine phosphatase)
MKVRDRFRSAERFVRSYTEGMRESEIHRLFNRDAVTAYEVVTRGHAGEAEPAGRVRRFLHRARVLFVGLSFKLSPARRLVFAICIVLALVALVGVGTDAAMTVRDTFFFTLSIAGLVLLLVLELADRIVVRDELEVARELQRALLPHEAPVVQGYDFAFSYRTANTIGGDYYEFLSLADGRLVLVVGDASGHGIAAGLLMAIANSALKVGFDSGSDPVAAAESVNHALCRTGGTREFMTLFCGVLDPSNGRFRFICAGHPYPYLRRAGGEICELGAGSLPLGMRLEINLEADETVIEPGDTLLLYTDGIVETLAPGGEAFGFERLRAALAPGGSSRAVHDRVLAALDSFRAHEPVHDDCSLVVVNRTTS